MSWLAKLAPFGKGSMALAELDGEINGAACLENTSPPLMCLVSDASGRASFKTHTFADAESATDFVLYWFPNQSEGGIISFWAMTHEPTFGLDDPSESAAEPLVMIRDVTRDGVVYLFSFSDIESAQAFLREEVQHGTDLAAMMLYWAVPVRMEADPWGKMMLTPSLPPGTIRDSLAPSPTSDMWSLPPVRQVVEPIRVEPIENSRKVMEEAPNARTGVAEAMSAGDDTFQLTAWMDRERPKPSNENQDSSAADDPSSETASYIRKPRVAARAEPPDVAADTHLASQPPEAIVEATSALSGSARVEETPRVAEVPPALVSQVAQDDAEDIALVAETPIDVIEEAPVMDEAAVVDEVSVVQEAAVVDETLVAGVAPVAAEEPTTEPQPDEQPPVLAEATIDGADGEEHKATVRFHTNGNGHVRVTEVDEQDSVEPAPESAEIGVHQNGHSSGEPADANGTNGAEATALPEEAHAENGHLETGVDIRIDIHLGSSRAMKVKRWEVKDEPFDGFNSPPGRF